MGGNTGNRHDGILRSVEEQMCKPKLIIRQRTCLQDREGKERREKEEKRETNEKQKKEMVPKCCSPCHSPCI